ncbi:hypothetical protein ACPA54_33285 [Uniformispora flossi]|uniref:hypothetical protein n=1 Tax=Uniformispora flossi TaxID=3390723 RepID=UPI003C30756D
MALSGSLAGRAQAATGPRTAPAAPRAPMLDPDNCGQYAALPGGLDANCYADAFDEYGNDPENGCDGWGEPTGYCLSKIEETGGPSWWKDFPGWLKFQVFDMATNVFSWWAVMGDPQLRKSDGSANGTVGYVAKYTNVLVIFFLILSVLIAVVRLAFSRDGRPAKELAKSLVTFSLISGLLLLFADMLIRTSRELFDYIIRTGMQKPGETAPSALSHAIREILTGINSGSGFHLLDVVGGIIVICVSLVLYVHMVIRYFLIIYYVGTMPLMAAAASLGESGKQALKEQCVRLGVWIFILDLMGLMMVIGYREIIIGAANSTVTGAAATWRGLIILCLITMVLPATMRAAAPFMSHAAGSNQATVGAVRAGFAVGAMAVGGAAWGLTRGFRGPGAGGASAGGAPAAPPAPPGVGAPPGSPEVPPPPARSGFRAPGGPALPARSGRPPGRLTPAPPRRPGGGGGVPAHPAGAVGGAGSPADLAAGNLEQSDPRVGLPDPLPRGDVGTNAYEGPDGSTSDAAVLVDAAEKKIQWLHAQGDTNMGSAAFGRVEAAHQEAQERARGLAPAAGGADQVQLDQVGRYIDERRMGRVENPITPAEAESASRNGTLPSLLNARMGLGGSGGSGDTGGGGMPPGPGGAGRPRPPAPPTV